VAAAADHRAQWPASPALEPFSLNAKIVESLQTNIEYLKL
jgi:hypothetical protein